MEGWIKLHRAIQNNPFWGCEKFTRGQAWVDLLLMTNHKDSFFYKRGNKVTVKRGQVGRSSVELADRWQWSRSKVSKFLKDLEKEQQIKIHKSTVTQVLTIVNYDLYQEKEQQKNSRKTAEEQQKDTYKNVKKEKNVEEGNSQPPTLNEINSTDDPDTRTDKFLPFGILDAKETLHNIYPTTEQKQTRIRELTGEEWSEQEANDIFKSFYEMGVTNYYNNVRNVAKLKAAFNNWITKEAQFKKQQPKEQEVTLVAHFEKYFTAKKMEKIMRGKFQQWETAYEKDKFKYTNIAKGYSNPTITPPLIYEICKLQLSRNFIGSTEEKKLTSFKKWLSSLSDYNQNKGDIREQLEQFNRKKDRN